MSYKIITVESFRPSPREKSSNELRIRPAFDQDEFKTTMRVECNNDLKRDHPAGTRFRIKGKVVEREGTKFIYSHYLWSYEVLR